MFLFQQKAIKKHFLIFWIEKKVLWTSKVKFSQSRKKSPFCKGVSPWFLSKNRPFFICFFSSQKSQKETFFDILDRRECFLHHISKVLTKSKKIDIFQSGQFMVFAKKLTFFSYVFFLAKQARKKTFLIFQIEKNTFQTCKVNFQKSRKNRHSAKGLVHGIFQKIDLFLICSFEQRKLERNIF